VAHNFVCKRNLINTINSFYHIRQVAARVTKFVPRVHLGPGPPFWGKGRL